MIKINDLRIGNHIIFGILNIVKVESIKPKTLIAKAKDSVSGKDEIWDMVSFSGNTASGNSRIEGFTPIPLTEDILLKCGFKILNHEFDSTFYSINVSDTVVYLRPSYLSGFYWGFVLDDLECEINDCKRIEFVHQLQNLYFALTGQELEINL